MSSLLSELSAEYRVTVLPEPNGPGIAAAADAMGAGSGRTLLASVAVLALVVAVAHQKCGPRGC